MEVGILRSSGAVVDVIVPTYNGTDHLPRLLDSLERQTCKEFTCTVIDDCSPQDIAPLIRGRYPWVNFVVQKRNKGPAHNRNVAAGMGKSPYIAVFDDDTFLEDEFWLDKAVRLMREEPGLGQAGAMILNGFDPAVLLDCGIERVGLVFGGRYHAFRRDATKGGHLVSRRVLGVCSAGMIMRRDVFELVGGFDASYFYPCEDLDLSLRIHLAGLDVRYEPSLVVHHLESQAMGKSLERKMYLYRRNCLLALAENYPAGEVLRVFKALAGLGLGLANGGGTAWTGRPEASFPATPQSNLARNYLRAGLYLTSRFVKILRKRRRMDHVLRRPRRYLLEIEQDQGVT
ncbi:glycosyltransferase family 2 protein [Desulfonatronum parangueonense]